MREKEGFIEPLKTQTFIALLIKNSTYKIV